MSSRYVSKRFAVVFSPVLKHFSIKCGNHNSIREWKRVVGAKHGKTLAIKSVIVLGSVLIGWENGLRFFSQSKSLTLSNQITFNFHLKIVLESKPRVFVNHNIHVLPCKLNRTWFFLQIWKGWSLCYKLKETYTTSILLFSSKLLGRTVSLSQRARCD